MVTPTIGTFPSTSSTLPRTSPVSVSARQRLDRSEPRKKLTAKSAAKSNRVEEWERGREGEDQNRRKFSNSQCTQCPPWFIVSRQPPKRPAHACGSHFTPDP